MNAKYAKLIKGVFFISLIFSKETLAENITFSVAKIANLVESEKKGPVIDLLAALDSVYREGEFEIKVYPFKRSMNNVIKGISDVHYPFLKNPLIAEETLSFRYSTESVGSISFAIYTNTNNIITKDSILSSHFMLSEQDIINMKFKEKEKLYAIKNMSFSSWNHFKTAVKKQLSKANYDKYIQEISRSAFPYKIETDRAHVGFLDFPTSPISTAEQGLKKLKFNRTDAYVFAFNVADSIIIDKKLSYIHRQLYKNFDIMFVIHKSDKWEKIDTILSNTLEKALTNKDIIKIRDLSIPSFKAWQPSEMNW